MTDTGEGTLILALHGGGSPLTVSDSVTQLAADDASHARVITPTHPVFTGPRDPKDSLTSARCALRRAADRPKLSDVTVVGNSIGRWIAAEMAIIGSPRVSRYVIVVAVGLQGAVGEYCVRIAGEGA